MFLGIKDKSTILPRLSNALLFYQCMLTMLMQET